MDFTMQQRHCGTLCGLWVQAVPRLRGCERTGTVRPKPKTRLLDWNLLGKSCDTSNRWCCLVTKEARKAASCSRQNAATKLWRS
jgi:hypothetical protein